MKHIAIIKLFTLLFISLLDFSGMSQISKGGLPYSFYGEGLSDSVSTVTMSIVNIDSILAAEEAMSAAGKPTPFRFGYAIDQNLNMENSGTWDTIPNGGRLWRLAIRSISAYSLNLIFNDFYLPDDASFFIYSADRSMILGAFTSDISNNSYRSFSTDLIKGDKIILEYHEPTYSSEGSINVSKVIHGYKNMFKSDGLGTSGSCNIDVLCPEGDEWCVERRAVSMILLDDNTAFCTGCLLNNEREDLTPYYLTAFHCADKNRDGEIQDSESANSRSWIFRFKYWRPTCNGEDPNHWVSISGANMRANYFESDMFLLELDSRPPSGLGVLYAGWNRLNVTASNTIGIHHPKGDAMKISFDNDPPVSSDYDPAPVDPNSHWKVIWDQGTTEGGSSGSPLFNQNHRVIGQLHGGYASCQNPDGADYYGRFDVSWNGGGTAQTRLRDWLDPDGTGLTEIRATGPETFLINRTLFGQHNFGALEDVHIEGNVTTTGTFCPPSSTLFTAENNSIVTVRAQNIRVFGGTQFKAGSNVLLISSGFDCDFGVTEGNFVDAFCDADINSNKRGFNQTFPKEENEDFLTNEISVYPNPTNGSFTIESNIDILHVELWSIGGQQISVMTDKPNNRLNLNIGNLPDGLYLLRLKTLDGIQTKRIVKSSQ